MDKDLKYFTKRKKYFEVLTVICYIVLGISILILISTNKKNVGIFIIAISFIILSVITTRIVRLQFKKLSIEFKTIYLTGEIQKIYPDCEYDASSGFSEDEIDDSHVLKLRDIYHSEDLMEGTFDGVSFSAADVKLQEIRSTGKSVTIITVFLGRVYKFQFNKHFISNIVINQPNFFKNLFGWNKVKTESVEFNSQLTVFSKDALEAFYILTPHFMEKLLELDAKYNDEISFSFLNNQLYIAINTHKDTFDIKMFNELNLSILDEYRNQLQDIKNFVYDLNLDNTLFKENE